MQFRRLIPAILSIAASLTHSASANIFEDAVNTVTAPVRAPVQFTQDVLRGSPPGQIIQNQVNINVAPQMRSVQSAATVVQQGNNIIRQIPRDLINNNPGSDWLKGYDILTASQRVQFEVALTSGRFLQRCVQQIQNCNPVQLVAVPVAGAMRDAYRVYVTYSYPLNPWLVQVLSRVVPSPVLARARWAVGQTPDMTVPGFLNTGHSAFGNQHAVALGNVIIFSEMPDLSTEGGWVWLLHELFHTEQYLRYSTDPLESIDGFAVDYVANSRGIEEEAQSNAVARFNQWIQLH